jgi:hypothetical protein
MKKLCFALFLMYTVSFCCASYAASADFPQISPWAENDYAYAINVGLVPEGFGAGHKDPMTRAEFVILALSFLDLQYNLDLNGVLREYEDFRNNNAASPPEASRISADIEDGFVKWAHKMDVIFGGEGGIFGPEGLINRQEAARILSDVYAVIADGDDGSSRGNALFFEDAEQISGYARDAVAQMREYDVMRGTGENRFSPLEPITGEQGVVAFLRLYLNAPVSRVKANVTPFRTFEDTRAKLLTSPPLSTHIINEWNCPQYDVIFAEVTGAPHGAYSHLWIIYRSGGWREMLQFLPQNEYSPGRNDFSIREMTIDDTMTHIYFVRDFKESVTQYSVDLENARLSAVGINTGVA